MARIEHGSWDAVITRECRRCGHSLHGRRRDARYCSRRCKDRQRRRRQEYPEFVQPPTGSISLTPQEAAILLDASKGMVVLNCPTGQLALTFSKLRAAELRRLRKRLEALGLLRLVGRCQRHPISRISERGWLLVARRYLELTGVADTLPSADRWWAAEQLSGNAAWPLIAWRSHVGAPYLMPNITL